MATERALNAHDVADMLRARRSGAGWQARCPVPGHGKGRGDRSPALSIREGGDGRTLLHCFAGCSFVEIVAALGVRAGDLMGNSPRREGEHRVQSLVAHLAPGEEQRGNEILLALWAKATEVRVSPDHQRLIVTPLDRVPAELIANARAHEIGVMRALEAIDGSRIYTTPGSRRSPA